MTCVYYRCSGSFIPLLPLSWRLLPLPSFACRQHCSRWRSSSGITPRTCFAFSPIPGPTGTSHPTPSSTGSGKPLFSHLVQMRVSPSSPCPQSQQVAARTDWEYWRSRLPRGCIMITQAQPSGYMAGPEEVPLSGPWVAQSPYHLARWRGWLSGRFWNETCRQNLTSCLGI